MEPGAIINEALGQATVTAVTTQSAVSDSNRKSIGEGTALFAHQIYAISNAHINRTFILAESLLAKSGEMVIETEPRHALSAIAAGSIAGKGAQTHPPISAPPPVTT